jgi:hypothetical protein
VSCPCNTCCRAPLEGITCICWRAAYILARLGEAIERAAMWLGTGKGQHSMGMGCMMSFVYGHGTAPRRVDAGRRAAYILHRRSGCSCRSSTRPGGKDSLCSVLARSFVHGRTGSGTRRNTIDTYDCAQYSGRQCTLHSICGDDCHGRARTRQIQEELNATRVPQLFRLRTPIRILKLRSFVLLRKFA